LFVTELGGALAEHFDAQTAQARLVRLGDDLQAQILALISRTMAKPFKSSYEGKPLVA